jgi:hypothetical protein
MPRADAADRWDEAWMEPLRCYRCGASLAALTLPLGRLEECPACSIQLHVCRMCRYYAPRLPKGCSEDDALEVRDKKSANFCDYFKPTPNAFTASELDAEQRARAELGALFGDGDAQTPESDPAERRAEQRDEALERANSLFKK